jgi:hypothetical protein
MDVKIGARGSVVVKALCYKPGGRGFDTRQGEFLNLPNPSGRTKPEGFALFYFALICLSLL